MSWGGPAAAAVMLLVLQGFVATGAAAQQTSSLGWARLPGAEACISTQLLAERVEQRLARRVFVSASQADLSLEGRVERIAAPEAFVAHLVISDRQGRVLGRRVLRVAGGDCSRLDASLVLVIAICIDPGASLPAVLGPEQALSDEARTMLDQLELPRQTEQELIAELTAPAAVEPPPRTTAERPRRDERQTMPPSAAEPAAETELRLGAGIGVAFGVLPRPSFGAVLTATVVMRSRLAVEVWFEGMLEQEQASGSGFGRGEMSFLGGGLGLCPPVPTLGNVVPHACAGMRAGALLASGTGFSESMASHGGWLEPVLYGGFWWGALPPLWLHAGGGAGVPLIRDRFRYADDLGRLRTLHRPGAVTGRFEIGAGMRF